MIASDYPVRYPSVAYFNIYIKSDAEAEAIYQKIREFLEGMDFVKQQYVGEV